MSEETFEGTYCFEKSFSVKTFGLCGKFWTVGQQIRTFSPKLFRNVVKTACYVSGSSVGGNMFFFERTS